MKLEESNYLSGYFIKDGYRNEYSLTEEQCVEIVSKIIDWCSKTGGTLGEVIMQDDDCIITAPELLSDIVDDIIKFETTEEQ